MNYYICNIPFQWPHKQIETIEKKKKTYTKQNNDCKLDIPTMPGPPTDPQPTANERIPRKRQARLDDNGEPAGLPAPKKIKSIEKNGPKKAVPAKTRPEKKINPALRKTASVEIPVTSSSLDVTKNTTTEPSETVVVVSSDDDDDVVHDVDVPEAPEEDPEAQLGAYSALFLNINSALNKFKLGWQKNGPHPFMCSLKQLLWLKRKVAAVVTSLYALPVDVKAVMAAMSIGSLTKGMPTRQAIFFGMQRFAGVLKQLKQLLRHKILMLQEKCWEKQNFVMEPSWPNFNASPRVK
jgi:hypothetical protein